MKLIYKKQKKKQIIERDKELILEHHLLNTFEIFYIFLIFKMALLFNSYHILSCFLRNVFDIQ